MFRRARNSVLRSFLPMKRQLACPKCMGRKIWVIEPFRIPDETLTGKGLPVVPHQPEAKEGFFALPRSAPRGEVDLYVCDGCGYSELWARNHRGLVEAPERGVRLLDSSTNTAGPFR